MICPTKGVISWKRHRPRRSRWHWQPLMRMMMMTNAQPLLPDPNNKYFITHWRSWREKRNLWRTDMELAQNILRIMKYIILYNREEIKIHINLYIEPINSFYNCCCWFYVLLLCCWLMLVTRMGIFELENARPRHVEIVWKCIFVIVKYRQRPRVLTSIRFSKEESRRSCTLLQFLPSFLLSVAFFLLHQINI